MDAIQGNCGREKSWSPRGHVESASWANTDSALSPLRLAGLAFFVGVDKVIATLDLLSCSKEQIAKDLLSGEEEEETQSSADDLTPSVTSHEASDLFRNQSGYSVTVTNIAAVCHLGLHAQPQLGALPGRPRVGLGTAVWTAIEAPGRADRTLVGPLTASLSSARFLAGDNGPGSSVSSDTEEDTLPANKCKKVWSCVTVCLQDGWGHRVPGPRLCLCWG